jgi:hypothetical protein
MCVATVGLLPRDSSELQQVGRSEITSSLVRSISEPSTTHSKHLHAFLSRSHSPMGAYYSLTVPVLLKTTTFVLFCLTLFRCADICVTNTNSPVQGGDDPFCEKLVLLPWSCIVIQKHVFYCEFKYFLLLYLNESCNF